MTTPVTVAVLFATFRSEVDVVSTAVKEKGVPVFNDGSRWKATGQDDTTGPCVC